jgi:hypothetical protein
MAPSSIPQGVTVRYILLALALLFFRPAPERPERGVLSSPNPAPRIGKADAPGAATDGSGAIAQ